MQQEIERELAHGLTRDEAQHLGALLAKMGQPAR
jgi:hypothetical protein